LPQPNPNEGIIPVSPNETVASFALKNGLEALFLP